MSLTKPYVICLTCTINLSFVAAQSGRPGVIDAYEDALAASNHANQNPDHVMVAGENFQAMNRGMF